MPEKGMIFEQSPGSFRVTRRTLKISFGAKLGAQEVGTFLASQSVYARLPPARDICMGDIVDCMNTGPTDDCESRKKELCVDMAEVRLSKHGSCALSSPIHIFDSSL